MALPNRIPRKTEHPYITRRADTCGGKPILAGTRIKVSDVVIEVKRMGMTPDEVVQAHPHLSLAQVHAALAYYDNHMDDIEREIAEDRRMDKKMRRGFVSILERKRGGTSDLHG